MRNLTVAAAVVLVASILLSSFAAAACSSPVDDARAPIVGWGYTFQEAQQDAYDQADAVGKKYKVCEFRQGVDKHHDPHCWWQLLIIWED